MRVVRVIERYLTGMRRFLSTKYTQGASFYKSLFDANMIAIVREVKVLEMQMS